MLAFNQQLFDAVRVLRDVIILKATLSRRLLLLSFVILKIGGQVAPYECHLTHPVSRVNDNHFYFENTFHALITQVI